METITLRRFEGFSDFAEYLKSNGYEETISYKDGAVFRKDDDTILASGSNAHFPDSVTLAPIVYGEDIADANERGSIDIYFDNPEYYWVSIHSLVLDADGKLAVIEDFRDYMEATR